MQGRIFSGREALQVKLVDQIGGEDEAVEWLVKTRNVDKSLKVVDWKPAAGRLLWPLQLMSSRHCGLRFRRGRR